MHGIQTSGNCIRNITSDELRRHRRRRDRRPAPLRRNPAPVEHAASRVRLPAAQVQDRRHRRRAKTAPPPAGTTSACKLLKNDAGELGFRVQVGGGMGRTPIIGTVVREFLPWNQMHELPRGGDPRLQPLRPARQHLEGAHQDPGEGRRPALHRRGRGRVPADRRARRRAAHHHPGRIRPRGRLLRAADAGRAACSRAPKQTDADRCARQAADDPQFARWLQRNVAPHQNPAPARRDAVVQAARPGARRRHRPTSSTPRPNWPTASRAGEARVTHDQNLLLPWVHAERPARAVAGRARGRLRQRQHRTC